MKIRLPEGFASREEAIRQIVRDEIAAADAELPEIRTVIRRYLLEYRGYRPDDLELDLSFSFTVGEERHSSIADILIRIEGRRIAMIKCFAGALASRERHALAIARLVDDYQVPLTIVTDAGSAVLLDTVSGKTLREGISAIPTREELTAQAGQLAFVPLPETRREKEQRILMAFDVVRCSIPSEP